MYVVTLGFLLYNCWWLLYKKNRWHNEQMMLAYGFSLLIIIMRIIFLIEWQIKSTAERVNEDPPAGVNVVFFVAEDSANTSKICLGICQVIAMFEIATRLKQMD